MKKTTQKGASRIDYYQSGKKYLQGKKTYIVGVLMILLGCFEANDQMILEGIGLITLRAGLTNK